MYVLYAPVAGFLLYCTRWGLRVFEMAIQGLWTYKSVTRYGLGLVGQFERAGLKLWAIFGQQTMATVDGWIGEHSHRAQDQGQRKVRDRRKLSQQPARSRQATDLGNRHTGSEKRGMQSYARR